MPADAPDIPALLARATQADGGARRATARSLRGRTRSRRTHHRPARPVRPRTDLVRPGRQHRDRLEDLQYTLGEGPALDAARTGDPVLVPDLHTVPEHRWTALLPATRHQPPRAVHAVPLDLGAIRLGVLTGHRATPGQLTRLEMSHLLALAEGATMILTTPDGTHDMRSADPPPLHRAVIHQATGALTVLLEIPFDQALARLRAYAFTHNRPLLDVAHDVVHHQSRLDDTLT